MSSSFESGWTGRRGDPTRDVAEALREYQDEALAARQELAVMRRAYDRVSQGLVVACDIIRGRSMDKHLRSEVLAMARHIRSHEL